MSGPRDCPARFATPRTHSRKTLGTAAARIAEKLGQPLMPWQQEVLDTALEVENGQFVYREVIITVPRQSGKTTSVLSLILARALMRERQNIIYTAQSRADARKKWSEDWLPVLELSPFSEHFTTRKANGDEALIFQNGSRQGLVAGTKKSGHGSTLDLAIVDEAFAQADSRLEQALKPAMITRNTLPHPGAQLWVVSTAGTMAMSPYLWGKVERGREIAASGLNSAVAYFEWSAGEDEDPADEETWWRCMPALGRTATIEAVRADFMSMDLHEFMRAYLNMWTTISLDPAIPVADWVALADPQMDTTGLPVTLAIDVTPDRQHSSVAASGWIGRENESGQPQQFVEVIRHAHGTDWVAPFVETLVNSNDVQAVIVDPAGPVNSLIKPLNDRGVQVQSVQARELAEACGQFYDGVAEHLIVHPGQQVVTTAIDGGAKRLIGDGPWAWGRKNSGVDISPLVAVTLAYWAAKSQLGSGGVLWDLDEIVARLRAEREESGVKPEVAPAPQPQSPVGGGVTVIPI